MHGEGEGGGATADGGRSGSSGGRSGSTSGRRDPKRGQPKSGGPERASSLDGPEADPEAVARQICLRLLTSAPRTQAQLAAALRRRGVPEDAATAVLERFAEVKLIDDELFARAWVESRHHGRGLAGRALGAELRQRGVTTSDIESALSQLDPQQEVATARELIARRLPGTAGMPVLARMRRLTSVLARKGYSAGLSYRVVREALEQEATDAGAGFDPADLPEPSDDEVSAEAWSG